MNSTKLGFFDHENKCSEWRNLGFSLSNGIPTCTIFFIFPFLLSRFRRSRTLLRLKTGSIMNLNLQGSKVSFSPWVILPVNVVLFWWTVLSCDWIMDQMLSRLGLRRCNGFCLPTVLHLQFWSDLNESLCLICLILVISLFFFTF